MSKPVIAALGVLLATVGFALGHFVASSTTRERPIDPPAPHGAEEGRRAIDAIVHEPATLDNAYRLAALLRALGPEAVRAIKPTLRDPAENISPAQALMLIQYWVEHDAEGAATWAANAPFLYRSLALALAVERLAETDLPAARRIAGGGGTGGGRDARLLKPLARGWVRSGEPGVVEWIRDMGLGFERQKALGAFAREMIRQKGARATAEWCEALPDAGDGFKLDAFRRVAAELAYADPAAGVAFYEKHRDGPYAESLLPSVANAWVAVDGPAAMQWLSERPASPQRDDAVLDAVRSWTMSDTDSLVRWARAQGGAIGPWFQPALPIFAKIAAVGDPAEGIQWAERIESPATRHLTLAQIASRWHARDPAAAEAWLARSPLSEEERARALEHAAPGAKAEQSANPAGS